MSYNPSRLYNLASKVKTRLTGEVVKTDVDLRRLVVQANLLDNLIDRLNVAVNRGHETNPTTIVSFETISTSFQDVDEADLDDDDDSAYGYSYDSDSDEGDSDSDDDSDNEEDDYLDTRVRLGRFRDQVNYYAQKQYTESEEDLSASSMSDSDDVDSTSSSDNSEEENDFVPPQSDASGFRYPAAAPTAAIC